MTRRSHRFTVLGSALTSFLLVTAVLASSADAEELSQSDATRDVQFFESVDAPATAAPTQRNGDLKHHSVAYGERRIRIKLRFRQLDHSEPRLLVGTALRYPGHGQQNYDEALIKAKPGGWGGKAEVVKGCAVKHHIDYPRNRAKISFPADCLESPRWLRFNSAALTTDKWSSPTYFYGDRAPGTIRGERWTKRVYPG